MKSKIGLFLLFLTSLMTACLEDKTNYDYKEIILPGEVMVKNLTGNRTDVYTSTSSIIYNMNSGKDLKLEVDSVVYSGDDELEYEWRLEGKVIGKGKQLIHTCLTGGVGYLYVFRKNAGNATAYQFRLVVRDLFSSGILVMAKNNGRVQLDWIEKMEAEEDVMLAEQTYTGFKHIYYNEHPDLYGLYNENEPLNMTTPLKIEGGESIDQKFSSYQLVAKDWENSVGINARTMKKIVTLKDEFVEIPPNLKLKDYVNIGKISMLLDESGKVYLRPNYDQGIPHTGRFSSMPLAVNVDGESQLVVADAISARPYRSAALIYEKAKKRFLAMSVPAGMNDNPDYAPLFVLTNPNNAAEIVNMPYYVNLNDFNKDLKAILWGGSTYEAYEPSTYILYEDGGEAYIQRIIIKYGRYPSYIWKKEYYVRSAIKLPQEASEALREGGYNVQVCQQEKNDILFFVKDNAIYTMTPEGNDIQFVIGFNEEDGNKITKFVITDTWRDIYFDIWERYFNGRVLAIAFKNGSFKVFRIYDDPYRPGKPEASVLVDKQYNGEVVDMKFFNWSYYE